MNMLKAYTRQKVLSLGLSVFPLTEKGSPQTEVHSISVTAQLPQISIDLPLHFLGLFLKAFLQRQGPGFILADKRTKKDSVAKPFPSNCGSLDLLFADFSTILRILSPIFSQQKKRKKKRRDVGLPRK